MPSILQKKSYGFVKTFWIDKDKLFQELKKSVDNLVSDKPEVQRVILFGSAANNKLIPSSDIDIAIIVSKSKERFIDRPSIYLEYFENIGADIDIFVYTENETHNDIPLLKTAMKTGKLLYEKVKGGG